MVAYEPGGNDSRTVMRVDETEPRLDKDSDPAPSRGGREAPRKRRSEVLCAWGVYTESAVTDSTTRQGG
jgi:hypothetical protein